jgi:glucosamine-6-phosphate deaminase
MKLIVLRDEHELSIYASNLVIEHITNNPGGLVVFPTGNTPLGMFEQLVKNYQKGTVSFNSSLLLELDEYSGIGLNDDLSLFGWLDRTFIEQVDFLPENIYRFNSDTRNPESEIQRIETIIQNNHEIDLLVLGLGPNGHIGFNEPGSCSTSLTRLVELTPESIQSNSRYWSEKSVVPNYGFTLGMNSILKARKVILLVQGSSKAKILYDTLNAPISDQIPATFLRRLENLYILADQEAASLLQTK